jgi:hypothetical protein
MNLSEIEHTITKNTWNQGYRHEVSSEVIDYFVEVLRIDGDNILSNMLFCCTQFDLQQNGILSGAYAK